MEQSVYTQISKSIGTQGELIDLPTLKEAETLFTLVSENKSRKAFLQVFKIYRFGKTAENFAEQEVSGLIDQAFLIGSRHFKNVY
jgi:hypothetical protein